MHASIALAYLHILLRQLNQEKIELFTESLLAKSFVVDFVISFVFHCFSVLIKNVEGKCKADAVSACSKILPKLLLQRDCWKEFDQRCA